MEDSVLIALGLIITAAVLLSFLCALLIVKILRWLHVVRGHDEQDGGSEDPDRGDQ